MHWREKGGAVADRVPLSSLSDSELEQRLIDLGSGLYPTTPDLATAVRHRLESEPAPRSFAPAPANRRGGPLTRSGIPAGPDAANQGRSWPASVRTTAIRPALWLAAALLLIAIAGGLVLYPEARNAIADRLGLQGVLIQWVDGSPTPEPSRVGTPLLLGRPVSLDEAQAAVDFPVRVPAAASFDVPQEIYLLDRDQGAMVSFVYLPRPGLPATDETGVGALLTQFQGAADRALIEKGLLTDGAAETHLETVSVDGEPGFWISGAPHAFFFVCYDAGECRQERYRLAGNVLIWEQDGVTLRLESALSRENALAVAESVPTSE